MIDTSSPSTRHRLTMLVIDPEPLTATLQTILAERCELQFCATPSLALQALAVALPSIVIISSRFAPTKHIQILEALKERSTDSLIPIIINLDLNQPTIVLPGTRWAGKLGLITPDTTQAEFTALLARLLA